MIRWFSILIALIWTLSLTGQGVDQRDFLPPYHFSVDSVSLLATWESPKIVLLEEDFEGDTFPPAGWEATSLGVGWLGVDDPVFRFWHSPQHPGNFALSNDDGAPYSNNGSMDFLYTPVIDLTVADSFKLSFDFYFDAAYGERAYLKYTLDSGATWQLLQQMDASLEWWKIEVDLSQFSGPDGEADFKLAFHADDNGYFASGWAVDDMVVHSNQNPQQVTGYKVFLDSELVEQLSSTSYQYSFEYSTFHNCGILACYPNGDSDTLWQNIHSHYLPKPEYLSGVVPDDAIILSWDPPADTHNLTGYNIYKDGLFKAFVPPTEPECCGYVEPLEDLPESNYILYEVTALYDLSEYGFPGETGESLPEGPAIVVTGIWWIELDFLEDWSAGTFDDNSWLVSGQNWAIDPGTGNEAPAAVFRPDSVLLQYEQHLGSYRMASPFDCPAQVYMEFDVSLSSSNPTGLEMLHVQVYDYNSKSWNTVRTYNNLEGSFGWIRDTINITGAFNEVVFRIRFNARGENSEDINYWAIDNIHIWYEINPPQNVRADLKPPSQDSILISWEEPYPGISEWKHWDDGNLYNKIGIGVGKSHWFSIAVRWTPEMLAELKNAILTAVAFIPGDEETFYKIAIWTGDNIEPVYLQAAGNFGIDHYNYITLEKPFKVDITKDLLVGYQYSSDGGYAMTVDNGPAIDGFGNMWGDGVTAWETLLEINPDLDFNWNIKAFFERDGVPAETYQLFRSLDGNEPFMIAEVDNLEYIDTVSSGYMTSCYKLKSVFPSGLVSDFSEEACVIFTNPDPVEPDNDGFLKIYPNPTSDVLFIESSEKIESIMIFDSKGISLEQWNNGTVEHWNSGTVEQWNGGTVEIRLSGLVPGIYLVQVETESGVVGRKVVVR